MEGREKGVELEKFSRVIFKPKAVEEFMWNKNMLDRYAAVAISVQAVTATH